MHLGKTLFAQLMDFLPWTTFTRIVNRYNGDHKVRTLHCTEHHRVMAFAQLTYRERLGLELTNTVYALDSTTVDLCLPVFPWYHQGGGEDAHSARSAWTHSQLHSYLGRQNA